MERCREWPSRARVLLAGIAIALAQTTAGRAQTSLVSQFFQTPSGNIGCAYNTPPALLRCDLRGQLEPRSSVPARPASCDLDWGDLVRLSAAGPVTLTCHGDTVLQPPGSGVLRYGMTWTRGPFVCTSLTTGLTCKNTAGHGFFLSLQRWQRL